MDFFESIADVSIKNVLWDKNEISRNIEGNLFLIFRKSNFQKSYLKNGTSDLQKFKTQQNLHVFSTTSVFTMFHKSWGNYVQLTTKVV